MSDPPSGGIAVHRSLNRRQGALGEFCLSRAGEGGYPPALSAVCTSIREKDAARDFIVRRMRRLPALQGMSHSRACSNNNKNRT